MTPSDTPPVGGDWVLVPREPTEEMVDAYNGALRAWVESLTPEQRGRLKRRATATGARQFKISPRQKLIARWSAVLSAAPPPPVADREAVARTIDPWAFRTLREVAAEDDLGAANPPAGVILPHVAALAKADAILRLLGLSPSLSPGELALADPLPPERCVCGCNSFARMDEEAPGGGYRKGRQFRCVHCKREHDERRDATATEARGDIDGR